MRLLLFGHAKNMAVRFGLMSFTYHTFKSLNL